MGRAGPGARPKKQVPRAVKPKLSLDETWRRKKTRVERVIAFLEGLPITKGKLVGKRMRLLPVQRRFIEDVYGRERVRIGVLSMPRGNGKTGLIAGLELCHLLGPEAEPRGECYSAAIDRQQAALIFDEMVAIIQAMPDLDERVNIVRWHKSLQVLDGDGEGSVYMALSADARRAHGLAPSFFCYDELAQAKDRILLDNLQTAMGKRNRSLGIVISTQAAEDEHPLSQIIDDGLAGNDASVVVHLLAAPKDANPFDEKVIASVNPAFGKFLDRDDVMAEARRAFRQPAFESAFRRLRLNQRVSLTNSDQLISIEYWAKCDKPVNADLFRDRNRAIFGGLDLSSQIDLTALVFACRDDDGDVHLLPYAWTPQGTIDERTLRDRAPYDAWVRQGLIKAVPGNSVDYDYVAADVMQLCQDMNVVSIAFDPWRIKELRQAFGRIGAIFPLKEFKQNYETFAPAIDAFERLVMDGRMRHGGHPVLRWCVSNTVTRMDPRQNRSPDKSRAAGRIDLMVAAIMAVGELERAPPVAEWNVKAMIA